MKAIQHLMIEASLDVAKSDNKMQSNTTTSTYEAKRTMEAINKVGGCPTLLHKVRKEATDADITQCCH